MGNLCHRVKIGFSTKRRGWIAQSLESNLYLGKSGKFDASTVEEAQTFTNNSACTMAVFATGVDYAEIAHLYYI